MAIIHCKIWYRLSISYITFEMKLKNGKTLTGEYISNMMIYVSICINFFFFNRRRAQRHPCLPPSVSRAVPANLSEELRTKGKMSLYGLYSSETAEKGKTAVLYASTANNLSVTLKLNTAYK